MKGDSVVEARTQEPDALEELARHVSAAVSGSGSGSQAPPGDGVQATQAGAARSPLAAAAPAGAAAAGVSVTGSSPNILSKEARHRLVIQSQRVAWFLLISAVAITVLVTVVSLGRDDDPVSGWWVAAVASLAVSGVTLWLVSYLTVMGFGNVSLSMSTSGKDEAGGS